MTFNPRSTEDRARSATANIADTATDLAGIAGHQVDRAFDSAQSTVRSLGEQGREAGERVQEVAGNLRTAIDKSVKEQPATTMFMAAAVGFVLGALWKS